MSNIAIIFARGGSKGLPNKNIKKIDNKPLIYYSIKLAKSCSFIKDVYISTDNKKIKDISLRYGAKIIDRPKNLATDKSPEFLAWKHAVKFLKKKGIGFKKIISLPTVAPVRIKSDIRLAIKSLDKDTDMIISVTESKHYPEFNMVTIDKKGFCSLLKKKKKKIARRQDSIPLFNIVPTVYVTTPEFILNNSNMFDGKVKAIHIPEDRAVDIDTKFDFDIAEFLLKKRK